MPQLQEIFGNFGIGFLVSAISAGATSMQVSPANAAYSFPALASGAGQFRVTVSALDSSGNPTNPEVMLVTANSSGAMTIVRAQEGTTAQAHAANERVEFGVTGKSLINACATGGSVTGGGPYTFDGTKNVMEVSASGTVNILTEDLVPFQRYTVADGGSNFPITLVPDAGLIGGLIEFTISQNGGACTFYWNGSNLRIIG